MLARFVLLALCVLGASATQHALSPKLIKDVSSTKLGQSILLELNSNEEVAPSLEGLVQLVQDIRTRIEDAQEADAARQENRVQQCQDDLLSLNQKKNNTILAIKAKQGQIAETSMQIGRLDRAIQILQDRIVDDRKNLGLEREKLSNETRDRLEEHAIFVQRTADTVAAIAAVDEILGLGWDVLEKRQDDSADDFANDDYKSTAVANFLQEKAKVLGEGVAKSLLQVAGLAASGLDKGDVDRLKELLNRLADELATYKQELEDDETQAQADFVVDERSYRESIDLWEKKLLDDINEKNRLIARRADAVTAIELYQEQWSGLKEQYTGLPDNPGAIEVLLSATIDECNTWQETYNARTAQRTAELGVISQIEAILDEKIASYRGTDAEKFSDPLHDANDYTYVGGTAFGQE